MILSILTLDRKWNELWIDKSGRHEMVIQHVTGLKRSKNHPRVVRLLFRGEYRGIVWNVHEIKEKW